MLAREALDEETLGRLSEASVRLMEGFEFSGYYAHRRHGLVQEQALPIW